MISYEDWRCSDEVLVVRLKAVLDPYLPVLTEALEPADLHEAREAYLRSLELLYYVTPSEEDFHKEFQRRVDAAVGLGVESSRQVIRDYRNTTEFISLNLFIFEHAKKVLNGDECLTTAEKHKVKQACERIQHLASVFEQEPESLFPVKSRGAKRRSISECTIECEFLLGKTRFLSLRLSHERKRLPR